MTTDPARLNAVANAVGGDEFVPLSTRYAIAERVLEALDDIDTGYNDQKCERCGGHPDGFTHQDECVTPRIEIERQVQDLREYRDHLAATPQAAMTYLAVPDVVRNLDRVLGGEE